MVLESTIVCVDNSEFARNGDFAPSRFAAQVDSVNMLCSAKMQSHPENTIGLLTTAGRSARILISATQDLGKVFACMHDVKLDGTSDIMAGIQKAQLALKHRQNTNQRQRIVVFVSSPISSDLESLVRLAKKLKKNNVAVDVVHVGDDTEGENVAKLDAFVEAVNSSDNSHILHVAAGGQALADALMSSEIYADRDAGGGGGGGGGGDGAADGGGSGGGGADHPFGVDPAVDPELAMALRLSMEDERARQAASGTAEQGTSDGQEDGAAAASGGTAAADDDADLYGTGDGDQDATEEMDEDALLQRAIALSQQEAGGSAAAAASNTQQDDEEMEELDEETRRAIEMSKADFDEETKKKDGSG